MIRYGMVIDLSRCIGCSTCTMACKAANATQRGVIWNRVLKYETGKYPDSRMHFLPIICMHCKEAECKKACPTGATSKGENGIVSVDNEKCMGCKYCMVACPYAARYFPEKVQTYYPDHMTGFEKINRQNQKSGVVQKCDFCQERLQQGLKPACVQACPTSARFFGDLNDPDSEVSKLIKEKRGYVLNPEFGTEPSVYYLPEKEVNK